MESITPHEIVRVVCQTMPARPSAVAPPELKRTLGGDLDAIVLKALRKNPSERYGSAAALADDVRRHLDSFPVEACAGGPAYRARCFVRRHRAALAAGLLVAASLVGGTVAALREARRAERRFEDVRKLAGSFLFEVHDAIKELPGATPARRLIVDKALVYLDSLAREAGNDLSLERELATAYVRVGDVQGYPANANVGDTPGAAASYRKAIVLARRIVEASPADGSARLDLGVALEKLGTTLGAMGNGADARTALSESQRILERLHAESPRDGDAAHALHVVHIRQGQLWQQEKKLDAALASYQAGQRVDEGFLKATPNDKRATRDLSVDLELVAYAESERDPAKGLELYEALLPPAVALAAANPTNAELQRDLLVGYEDVAQMHQKLGHLPQALDLQKKALSIAEALLHADPSNLQALQDLSVRHYQIGDVLMAMGDMRPALESYERSLAIDERVAARDATSVKAAQYVGESHINVASLLLKLGRRAEALDHDRRAIAAMEPFAARDPKNADLGEVLAEAHANLAEELLAHPSPGRPCSDEARSSLARAVAVWDTLGVEPGEAKQRRDAFASKLAACGAAPQAASGPPAADGQTALR
jgi:non-specific serine/threonine protein kinase/serine/threonine-protein kinase